MKFQNYETTSNKIKFGFLSFVYIIVFGIWLFNNVDIYAQTKPEKILVHDYNKPGKKNRLGGDFGAFADSKGLGNCYLFFYQEEKESLGRKGFLLIQWDTSKSGANSGYWSDLKHLNLQKFNYLSFYVKGFKGGENFRIGLRGKENAGHETKIPINKVLKGGVTTNLQKVTIPLKYFENMQDWRGVNIFSITFENILNSGSGKILLDEIVFEK